MTIAALTLKSNSLLSSQITAINLGTIPVNLNDMFSLILFLFLKKKYDYKNHSARCEM